MHSNQPERFTGLGLFGIKPPAIVVNLEDKLVHVPFQACLHARRLRVPRHIGERFLKNSVDGCGSFRIQI